MARYGKKASEKVAQTMREHKRGTLKSGSGKKVTSRKQAIAIGLAQARRAGGKVPPAPRRSHATKKKSPAQLDREIEDLLNKRARYMLVDAATGKDMREAHDFEIEHIQRNANKAGVASLLLGGGWKNPQRSYDVKLRLMNVHQPTREQRQDPKLPAETYTAMDRHGNTVATSSSVSGAMAHADTMMRTGSISVRGEYTSDGHHWGFGNGRLVAARENGKWRRY